MKSRKRISTCLSHLFQIVCNLCPGWLICLMRKKGFCSLLTSLILGLYYKLNWPKRASAVYWLLGTLLYPCLLYVVSLKTFFSSTRWSLWWRGHVRLRMERNSCIKGSIDKLVTRQSRLADPNHRRAIKSSDNQRIRSQNCHTNFGISPKTLDCD